MNPYRLLLVVRLVIVTALCWVPPVLHAQDSPAPPPDWPALQRHRVPEWFADAKFGIYAHWGVYCVPAFDNEWYPRNMYIDGNRVHEHHLATYGDLSSFGYKEFIPRFTAERFDAEAWADLYQKAGARFAGPVAEHHDGFSMWASQVNRWNAAAMGPRRDVTGELARALRKRGLKLITSFHHAFNIQGYYTAKAGWDTSDPSHADLYGQFADQRVAHDRWLAKIVEVIDRYRPDQIWFDFGLARIPDDYKRRMAAYYYGKEAAWGKQVIITRKGNHLPAGVGVLDIERGKMKGPADSLWQTDDSIAVNSWCWVNNLQLKSAEELLHELIDIVSKNGVLLLNVCPKADGTFPADQREILGEIGAWLKVNGEAIYATRPWQVHGDGPHLFDSGRGFGGEQVGFTGRDVRYTASGERLHAIVLGWPEGDLVLESVRVEQAPPGARVRMLGHEGPVAWHRSEQGQMVIEPPVLSPEERPCRHAYTFALEGFSLDLHPEARFSHGRGVTLLAEKAVLDGDHLRIESQAEGRANIGFWDEPGESVHWLVRIGRAGVYDLRAELAAAAGTSALTLEVAGQSVAFDVPATASWAESRMVPIGSITFEKPAVYHLVLRPCDPRSWRAVNVWQVQLARAES